MTSAPATSRKKTEMATVRVETRTNLPGFIVTLVLGSHAGGGGRPRTRRRRRGTVSLAVRDGDGKRLRGELLVPRLDGVRPGGEPLDLVEAVRAGHREERVGDDGDPGPHPGVDVALEGDDLGLLEGARVARAGRGHAEVEGLVLLRRGVDVVERGVGRDDVERLAGHQREDARGVGAPLLVELPGLRRRGIAPRDTLRDAEEDVGERAVRADGVRRELGLARVVAGAERVGRHRHLLVGRRDARQRDASRDDGRPEPARRTGRGLRGLGGFRAAGDEEEQQGEGCEHPPAGAGRKGALHVALSCWRPGEEPARLQNLSMLFPPRDRCQSTN